MYILSVDPGSKNLGLCVLHGDGDKEQIILWKVVQIPSSDALRVKDVLDAVLLDVPIDYVVIERQPPAAAMKRLQILFEMYFVMLGKPMMVMDARAKLKCAMNTPYWPSGYASYTSLSYKQRKSVSVEVVTNYLEATRERHGDFVAIFHAASKKDDYADSLLQARTLYEMKKT